MVGILEVRVTSWRQTPPQPECRTSYFPHKSFESLSSQFSACAWIRSTRIWTESHLFAVGASHMTKLTFIPLAVVLVLSCTGAAQQNSRSGEVRLQSSDHRRSKAVVLSGRVSGDRKTLVSQDDDQWVVSNPAALTGAEGRQVTVKCRLSSDQSAIYVYSVTTVPGQFMARRDDSAFRR